MLALDVESQENLHLGNGARQYRVDGIRGGEQGMGAVGLRFAERAVILSVAA